MSFHFVLDTYSYSVVDGQPVKARATIGNAQAGAWLMTLVDVVLAKGQTASDVVVGLGQDVRGKRLQLNVTVTDINANTNVVSSRLALSGGAPTTQQLDQTFDGGGDGDTTVFTFLVDLV